MPYEKGPWHTLIRPGELDTCDLGRHWRALENEQRGVVVVQSRPSNSGQWVEEGLFLAPHFFELAQHYDLDNRSLSVALGLKHLCVEAFYCGPPDDTRRSA